jgi:hypothetical protein
MPKNRNKNQKTPLISSQKENPDRNHGVKAVNEIFCANAYIPICRHENRQGHF